MASPAGPSPSQQRAPGLAPGPNTGQGADVGVDLQGRLGPVQPAGAAEDRQEAQTLRLVSAALERNMARGRNNLALAEKLQVYLGLLEEELRRVRRGDVQLAVRILREHLAKTTAKVAADGAAATTAPTTAAVAATNTVATTASAQLPATTTADGGGESSPRRTSSDADPASSLPAGDADVAGSSASDGLHTPAARAAAAVASEGGAGRGGEGEAPVLPPCAGRSDVRGNSATFEAADAGVTSPASVDLLEGGRPGPDTPVERGRGDPPDRLDGGAALRRVFSRSALVDLPGDCGEERVEKEEEEPGEPHTGEHSSERRADGGSDARPESGVSGGATAGSGADGARSGDAALATSPSLTADTVGLSTPSSGSGSGEGIAADSTPEPAGDGPHLPGAGPDDSAADGPEVGSRGPGRGGGMSLSTARAWAAEAEESRAALMGLLRPAGALPGPLEGGARVALGRAGEQGGAAARGDAAPGGEGEGEGAAVGRRPGARPAVLYALAGKDVPQRTVRVAAEQPRASAGNGRAGPEQGGSGGGSGAAAGGEDVRELAVLLYGMVSELRSRGYVGCEDTVEAVAAALEKAVQGVRARSRSSTAGGGR